MSPRASSRTHAASLLTLLISISAVAGCVSEPLEVHSEPIQSAQGTAAPSSVATQPNGAELRLAQPLGTFAMLLSLRALPGEHPKLDFEFAMTCDHSAQKPSPGMKTWKWTEYDDGTLEMPGEFGFVRISGAAVPPSAYVHAGPVQKNLWYPYVQPLPFGETYWSAAGQLGGPDNGTSYELVVVFCEAGRNTTLRASNSGGAVTATAGLLATRVFDYGGMETDLLVQTKDGTVLRMAERHDNSSFPRFMMSWFAATPSAEEVDAANVELQLDGSVIANLRPEDMQVFLERNLPAGNLRVAIEEATYAGGAANNIFALVDRDLQQIVDACPCR